MRESADLDELDRLLVTALQTAPRANWQQIGRVLDVSASTAARRWERLTDEGLAWSSCHPVRLPGLIRAIIEIDCDATRLHSVGATLAQDPHVVNVNHVTGVHDLVVIAFFANQASIGRYLRLRIGLLDGVQSVHLHVVTTLHTEASRWRLDRLAAPHRIALQRRSTTSHGGDGPDEADLALMAALSTDPRKSAADLARDTELSLSSVRRRLHRLDAAGLMAYRCEVARCVSGWPVAVNLWGVLPPGHTARVTAQVAELREIRCCASLSGPDNLMLSAWLRSIDDIEPFETVLTQRIPEFAISARNLVLWHMKLGDRVLDPDGRLVRRVPRALWAERNALLLDAEWTVRQQATHTAPELRHRIGRG
jgi:DNA-binding Lrp family transcriptional regulator